MSDPRGIMNVPEVGSAVQASARLEKLSRRRRREEQQRQEDEHERRRRNIDALEEQPEDGEEHVDLLA